VPAASVDQAALAAVEARPLRAALDIPCAERDTVAPLSRAQFAQLGRA
jgi:hypothetical protein